MDTTTSHQPAHSVGSTAAFRRAARLSLLLLLCLSAAIHAHNMSPRAEVKQMIGSVEVRVDYGRPGVGGREVWGALVPYGELWKTGADRMTNITISAPLVIGAGVGGHEIPAGTYGILTIPGPDTWTIVFTRRADIHRPSTYVAANDDLLRLEVKPATNTLQERLQFTFDQLTLDSAELTLTWERLHVAIPLAAPQAASAAAEPKHH